MSETIVVFRKDETGNCFALFPELPSDYQGFYCVADYHGCIAQSDPAAPAEYADLYEELERRGYILSVRQRAKPEMHARRQ